jgi:hypothetical protein
VAAPAGTATALTEWHEVLPERSRFRRSHGSAIQLQRFGAWLGLTHQDKPWRLTTHQGRKTFARFAALRDRTCLFALAQHLGHRERAETDHGYAGSDYRLAQEIDAEILQQSVNAWEHMLAAPGLGGRAGAEIMAKRPRFRGKRVKQDLAELRAPAGGRGLVLGVCDWGFCVYREEHSACLGNAAGPEPGSPRAVDLRALQELRGVDSSIGPTGSNRSDAASAARRAGPAAADVAHRPRAR